MQRDPHFRIVVALDLSEYAEIVLEHALDQAARHSAPDLHFLSVIEDRRGDVERAKRELADLVLSGIDSVGERARDWHARLHVRTGRAHEEIAALAAEIDAHLIVCGRFGVHRHLLSHASTAHRIIEHAPCPVLAVNLVDRPVQTQPQCPDCVRVRAETDGERWFCDAHSAPGRVTVATTRLPPSTSWTGGGLMW